MCKNLMPLFLGGHNWQRVYNDGLTELKYCSKCGVCLRVTTSGGWQDFEEISFDELQGLASQERKRKHGQMSAEERLRQENLMKIKKRTVTA